MYVVSDTVTGNAASFAPTDLTANTNRSEQYSLVHGTATDELTVFKTWRANPVKLTYVNFALWTHADTATGKTSEQYIIFGFPTGTANMPRTGSASYRTFLTGNYAVVHHDGTRTEFALGGTSSFSVDFGTTAITTQLLLRNAADQSYIGTYNGSGATGDGQFFGEFTSPDDLALQTGVFTGGFFGPSAQEMAYAYYMYGEVGGRASAAPGNEEHYVYGTVLGAK